MQCCRLTLKLLPAKLKLRAVIVPCVKMRCPALNKVHVVRSQYNGKFQQNVRLLLQETSPRLPSCVCQHMTVFQASTVDLESFAARPVAQYLIPFEHVAYPRDVDEYFSAMKSSGMSHGRQGVYGSFVTFMWTSVLYTSWNGHVGSLV